MTKTNDLGKRLQQIRKSRGITQAKLAELAGIHEKHISKLELGTYMPSIETLNKILSALELNIEDVGLNLERVPVKNNSFYIKSMQILNNSSENELKFYYYLLKAAQKNLSLFEN